MKCTNCGYENPNDALFCEACGSKLIRPPYGQNQENASQEFYTEQNDGQPYQQTDYQGWQNEEEQWEEERRMRAQRREQLRKEQQKKENKRIVMIGIIVAAIIAVAGVGAFFGINYFMGNGSTESASVVEQKLSEDQQSQTEQESTQTMQTSEQTIEPTQEATPEPTQEATPEPTQEAVTISVENASNVNTSGYSKVTISSAEASSTIVQEGYDNSVQKTYDGDEKSSWQDGIDGEGVGEWLHYNFDRSYNVRYVTLKMGNWRNQENYDLNSRPKDITVWFGGQSYQVTIPDGKTEYCLELSGDISCSEMYLRIDSVYAGTKYDDTCISEVGIYGN